VNSINVKFILLFHMIETHFFNKNVVCISETHVTFYTISLSQSKWSWLRSHLTNLHVRLEIDFKKVCVALELYIV